MGHREQCRQQRKCSTGVYTAWIRWTVDRAASSVFRIGSARKVRDEPADLALLIAIGDRDYLARAPRERRYESCTRSPSHESNDEFSPRWLSNIRLYVDARYELAPL